MTIAWIALCLMPFVRRWGDRRWSIAVIVALVLAYAGQAMSMTIFYNGAQGDDRYQVAFIDVISRGHVLGDYYYPGVRSHYPPLVYWLGGLIKAITGAGAVGVFRWMAVLTIPAAAAVIAWAAIRAKGSPTLALVLTFGFGGFLVSYLTNYGPTRGLWGLLILKPQQVVGGALAVGLPLMFAHALRTSRRRFLAGATALIAGIVLTLPLYVPMAIVAGMVALGVRRRRSGERLKAPGLVDLAAATGLAALLTSFYWIPMASAVFSGRWQNNYLYWQSIDNLDPSRWTIGFAMGIPLVFGVLAIRRYRDPQAWAMAAIAISGGLLYVSAWVTYPLMGISALSWWAPVPAVIALCVIASRYIRDWLELRFRTGPVEVSFKRSRWPAVMLVATLVLPFANWNTLTDAQLLKSHDSINADLLGASRVIHDSLAPDETFVAGAEELLLPALSERGLTVVPHAFYANPMGETDQRRRDVEALMADPSCTRLRDIHTKWRTRAIAAEVIPVSDGALVPAQASVQAPGGTPGGTAGGAPGGAAGGGAVGGGAVDPHSPAGSDSGQVGQSLGISFLDPIKKFSPRKVGETHYIRLSPSIASLPCWKQAFTGPTITVFIGDPGYPVGGG